MMFNRFSMNMRLLIRMTMQGFKIISNIIIRLRLIFNHKSINGVKGYGFKMNVVLMEVLFNRYIDKRNSLVLNKRTKI